MGLFRIISLLMLFSCSAMAIWDEPLNRLNIFGINLGVVNYAQDTIQPTEGTEAIFTSPCDGQSPVMPFFSTYDAWNMNTIAAFSETPDDEMNKNIPIIAVKLTQAEINKLPAAFLTRLGIERPNIDFFINVQGLPDVKNVATALDHIMLQPHTWAHAHVPVNGSIQSTVDSHVFRKADKNNTFNKIEVTGGGNFTTHDSRLSSPHQRQIVELNYGGGFNRNDVRRIYISTAKMVGATVHAGAAVGIEHQPVGRTAVTIHMLLNDVEYNAIWSIFRNEENNAQTNTLNHILASLLFDDYPGFNELRGLLTNLRDAPGELNWDFIYR